MQYYEPNFLNEALVLLERFGHDAHVLAGGTRLGPKLRASVTARGVLVNIKRIDELSSICLASDALHVGSLATASQLREHPLVREHAPLLALAAATMGARQLQTMATLGGNVCSGDPASDLSTALLAYDARCEVASPNDAPAVVPLRRLLDQAPRVLHANELLVAVEIPLLPHRFAYQKMMTRRAFEMALVAVAAVLRLDGDLVAEARIALAGAAATPIRATSAEAVLAGVRITPGAAREAAQAASTGDAQPASDWRASERYRRELVRVLTERAILEAVNPSRNADGRGSA